MRIESAVGRCVMLVLAFPLLAGGCGESAGAGDDQASERQALLLAEDFIDAFYTWDANSLASLMVPGDQAEAVLYYQGWAQAAHYQVIGRQPCRTDVEGRVVCAITVTDDFGTALGYTATDTFTLVPGNGMITAVSFQGDDPPIFEALFDWIAETRPQILAGPCRDMFAGGETPGDCARAIAGSAREYADNQAR